jgi:hypothetical protein
MKKWYVIYTKSRKEKIALQNLNAQGYDAQLPLSKLEKIIRHKKLLSKSLFSRDTCLLGLMMRPHRIGRPFARQSVCRKWLSLVTC